MHISRDKKLEMLRSMLPAAFVGKSESFYIPSEENLMRTVGELLQ